MFSLVVSSLRKRWKRFFLIFIQFLVGVTALIFAISSIEKIYFYENNVKKIMPTDTLQIYTDIEFSENENNICQEIYQKLKKEIDSVHAGVFQVVESLDRQINFMFMNRDYIKMQQIQLKNGSWKPLESYSGERVVPVIISANLIDKYKMNELYHIDCEEHKELINYQMKIVGIMPSDIAMWKGGSNIITDTMNEKEGFILFPQVFDLDGSIPYGCNLLIQSAMDGDMGKLREKVQQFYNENGVEVEIQSLHEEIQNHNERKQTIIVGTICFATILLLLSVLGCIGTLLSMVLLRKQEFGIYFSLGITKRRLIEMVWGEIMGVLFLSFLTAVFLSVTILAYLIPKDTFELSILTTSCALGVMLLCGSVCIVIPAVRMSRMKPIELINEREQ